MNLTLPVSGAWRTTAIDLGQWLPGGSADGRNRRTSPVAEPLGEGLLTEATAVARPGTRELVFLPRNRHWICRSLAIRQGDNTRLTASDGGTRVYPRGA